MSETKTERVSVEGFKVGVCINPNNDEDCTKIVDLYIGDCKYDVQVYSVRR